MSRQSEEEVLLRNYLLGNLGEAAREQIEERLLGDDGFAESLSAAQDALIDDYVFEALPADERESFDQNFIIDDERRRKMLFARALKIYVDERDGPRQPASKAPRPASPPRQKPLTFIRAHKTWAAVSLVALLLLPLAPAVLRRLQAPDPGAPLRERRASAERRVAEVNRSPPDESVKALPASELALLPTLLREDGAMPRAALGADIKLLTLKLGLTQGRHENYSALVLTVEGEELFAVGGLTPQSDAGVAAVPLNIPAELLRAGDYQVLLRAVAADGRTTEAGRYNFRVTTQK